MRREGLAKISGTFWEVNETDLKQNNEEVIIFDSMCSLAFSRLSGRGIVKTYGKSRAI